MNQTVRARQDLTRVLDIQVLKMTLVWSRVLPYIKVNVSLMSLQSNIIHIINKAAFYTISLCLSSQILKLLVSSNF